MKKSVSSSDIEKLSAYLDGYLTQRQRSRLEARIQDDSSLKTSFSELQQTRSALRKLPQIKAPRSFILSPEMADIKSKSRISLYPAFRFATTIASLLFVFAVAGDFLGAEGKFRGSESDFVSPQVVAVEEISMTPQLEVEDVQAVEAPLLEFAETDSFAVEQEIAAEPEGETDTVPNEITAKSEVEEPIEVMSGAPAVGEADAFDSEQEIPVEEEFLLVTAEISGSATTQPSETANRSLEESELELEDGVPEVGLEDLSPPQSSTEISTWDDDAVSDIGIRPDALTSKDTFWNDVSIIRLLEIFFGSAALILGILALIFRRKD